MLGSPVVLSAEPSPPPLVLAFLGQVLYYSLDLEWPSKAHASKACSPACDTYSFESNGTFLSLDVHDLGT